MSEPDNVATPLAQRIAERPRNLRPSEAARRLAVLERAPLFYALSDPALRALARRLRSVTLAAGARLLRAGTRGDTVYLVEEGRVRLLDGSTPVADIAPGGICGEAALAGDPESADVVAVQPTRLLALDASLAEHFLGSDSVLIRDARRLANQRALATAREPHRPGTAPRMTVAVFSTKGGSGTTTLAVNLAAALASERRGQVALLDLAIPYCDAALLANTTPAGSLAAVSRGAGDDLRERILGVLVLQEAGFALLPATLRPEEAELVTPQLATAALRILEREYPLVVVDLGSSLAEVDVVVLEHSDQVVVVVPPEIAAVKDTVRILPLLEDVLGIARGRVALVLNDRLNHGPVTPPAVVAALGTDIDLIVENDGNRPERLALEGSVAVLDQPRSPIGRGARALAQLLLGRAESGPRVAKEE